MSAWEQEESGINISISARGAWGQPEGTGGAREEQTLVKTDTKHKNKTLDTQKNTNTYKA